MATVIPSAHKALYASVLSDLILATHCHSCGASMNVSLIGYVGQHCSKRCWSSNEMILDEFDCPFGGEGCCKVCDRGFVAHTRSTYHRRDVDRAVELTHHCEPSETYVPVSER
jgi:hypothetical protein